MCYAQEAPSFSHAGTDMATKEEHERAFKAFKKRLKIYQADAAGSVAPASALERF